MEHQVPEQIKTERSHVLLALDSAHSRQYMEELRGQQVEILIEENMVIDGVEYQVGHTKEYIRAAVISDEDLTNQIITAVIGDTIEERLCAAKPLNRI